MVLDRIIAGIIDQWFIIGLSLFLLISGTVTAYHKFGLKRVLLGRKNDTRELIYRREDGSIVWKPTLKTWQIILTGGMSILSLFLMILILALSFIYQHDVQAIRDNDELLCQEFGTTLPTIEQLEEYYQAETPGEYLFNGSELTGVNLSEIKFEVSDERGTGDS